MATQTAGGMPEGRSKAPARSGYFFSVSVVLLALVLIGFAPTLYLRVLFPRLAEPNMPFYLYVHGAVLTAWFVWLVVQTWLVRIRNTALHRRTGWIGATIAAGVLFVGAMATFGVVGRILAISGSLESDISVAPELGVEGVTVLQFTSWVVWGSLLSLAAFAVLIGAGVVFRTRTQVHKRLMIIASIGLMGPALARISRWPFLGGEDGPFEMVVTLTLLFSVAVHDLLLTRRVHRATYAASALILLVAFGSNVIAATEFGQALVRSLA